MYVYIYIRHLLLATTYMYMYMSETNKEKWTREYTCTCMYHTHKQAIPYQTHVHACTYIHTGVRVFYMHLYKATGQSVKPFQ